MSRKEFTPSVLFYKRMIAATLATVILLLTVLNIVNGVRLHRALGELREYEAAEGERLALEEAERLRNAIPPEQEKPAGEADAAQILSATSIIAHAMGGTDGVSGLNCLEGFEQNYAAGVRVFEADFRLTSDGYVVLRHDWRVGWQEGVDEANIPTLEEFLSRKVMTQYTPLSFTDLLKLMVRYPDICIITDTKFMEPEAVVQQFTQMLNDAKKLGLSYLFDRMYVQIYSPLHLNIVDTVHHFPHYIYTLYQDNFDGTESSFRAKADFAVEKGVEAITMWDFQWNEAWRPIAEYRGLKVYVHTVNDREAARELLLSGVSAVYTDELLPSDLEG
ncbi:MAG: hypothetical protein K6G54_09160 [Oscillospiraceae bacterium]|nr:hypothetical protein [Oscillospiraceae bacterium]